MDFMLPAYDDYKKCYAFKSYVVFLIQIYFFAVTSVYSGVRQKGGRAKARPYK